MGVGRASREDSRFKGLSGRLNTWPGITFKTMMKNKAKTLWDSERHNSVY
jgi:hypothetical protein